LKKRHILAIIGVITIFAGLSYAIYIFDIRALSYVSISINPDIELAVNGGNIVEEVISINEEADIITSDLDLVGLDVGIASEKIVGAAVETGYIDEYSDENTIVITTVNENEMVRQALETKVMNKLDAYFTRKDIHPILLANGLTDELKTEATSYSISNGKMLLVNRAATIDKTYTKEILADMSISEIQDVIKDYVKTRHESLQMLNTELKSEWRQTKETLKTTYKTKLEELKLSLLNKAGIDVKNMTEEEIKAATETLLKTKKEQISYNVEEIKEEITTAIKSQNSSTIKENIKSIKERIRDRLNKEE
jgi:gas vesicle protein